jgi:hypothetical protein
MNTSKINEKIVKQSFYGLGPEGRVFESHYPDIRKASLSEKQRRLSFFWCDLSLL